MLRSKLFKKIFCITSVITIIGSNAYALDVSVQGIKFLNNEIKSIDYKVDDSFINNMKSLLNGGSFTEIFSDNVGRETPGLSDKSKSLTYLIENNIVSRTDTYTINNPEMSKSKVKDYNLKSDSEYTVSEKKNLANLTSKSEFYTYMYKAKYGNITSRPLVYSEEPYRNIRGIKKFSSYVSAKDYVPRDFVFDGIALSAKESLVVKHNKDCAYDDNVLHSDCNPDCLSYINTSVETSDASNTNFDIQDDLNVLVSSDVTELYLDKLLDIGLINRDDLSNSQFLSEYQKNSGRWSTALGVYEPFEVGDSGVGTDASNAGSFLGQSFKVVPFDLNGNTVNYNQSNGQSILGGLTYYKVPSTYFKSEELQVIDALKIVEDFLRVTEKNMSDTEADIVAYKYGCPYLSLLNADTAKTVKYLIAMGVVDFEDREDFSCLYDVLTKEKTYDIIYKVFNTSARTDYSKVQLTDTDSFWKEKGYTQSKITLVNDPPQSLPWTVDIQPEIPRVGASLWQYNSSETGMYEEPSTLANNLTSISADEKDTIVETDKSAKTFIVTKGMVSSSTGLFKGKSVKDITTDDFDGLIKSNAIGTGKNSGFRIMEFKVRATSESLAVAYIDSNFTFSLKDSTSTIHAVTMISDENNTTSYRSYISATEFTNGLSSIEVLYDKVLKNKMTGAMAIILQDSKTALIGNTIISLKDKAVFNINNETYYSLEVIKGLMDESYLSTLDPLTLYTSKNVNDTNKVDVVGSSGNVIERISTATFDGLNAKSASAKTQMMYNTNQMTRSVNTVMKDYEIPCNGVMAKVRMVVDWEYVLPSDATNLSDIVINDNATIKEVSSFLFTRSDDKTLGKWWDNNVGLSNGLMNLMMGTTKQSYIKSGYMAPSITILNTNPSLATSTIYDTIFADIELDSSYITTFLGGDFNNLVEYSFNKSDKVSDAYGKMLSSRTIECIAGTKYTKNSDCYDFSGRYVLSPAGNLYKSIIEDDRFTYSKGILTVSTRVNSDSTVDLDGKFLKLNGEEYFVNGYSAGGTAYRLVKVNPVNGYINSDGTQFKLTSTQTGGTDVIKNKIESIVNGLNAGSYVPVADMTRSSMSSVLPVNNIKNGLYISEGNVYSISSTLNTMYKKTNTDNSIGIKASAFPCVYPRRSQYALNSDDELVPATSTPYLMQGNIFYSGIIQSMIDSIIANSVKAVNFNQLPIGSDVIIQDSRFSVTESGLVSYANTNKTLVTGCVGSSSDPTDAVLKFFSGLNILYSGRPVSFTSYITNVAITNPNKDKPTSNTLVKRNGSYFIKSGDKYDNFYTSAKVDSVSFGITLDPSIKFRLIDGTENLYTIMLSSDQYSEGYLDNTSYFKERLTLSLKDDLYLKLLKSKYEPLSKFNDLAQEFKDTYKAQWYADAKTFIKGILVAILSYIMVILPIGAILNGNAVSGGILYSLKYQNRTDKKGVDLISIASFGLLNVDDKVRPLKLIVGQFLLFLMLFLVLEVF